MSERNEHTVIPVTEEHVTVSKEVVETGKVLIRKKVTEEEGTINIPLILEGYQVERRCGSKELFICHPSIRYEGKNMIIPVVCEGLMDIGTDGLRNTDRRESDATVQRVEENLDVGQREVKRGGVRVRSRVVEETLRLRKVPVHVECNPENRPLGDADRDAFQEQTIELTERAEVAVVNKEARVVEEIRLSKEMD